MGRRLWRMLGVFVLLIASIGANADVIVTGGKSAQQKAIAATYAALPDPCKSTLRVAVVLMTPQQLLKYVQAGLDPASARMLNATTIDGVYEDPKPTITLKADGDTATLCQTFAHEYAHCLWERRLTRDQRDDYTRLYIAQKAAHGLVTPYASTSNEEGFAEAFSYYIVQPAVLAKRDPASMAFLAALYGDKDAAKPSPPQSTPG